MSDARPGAVAEAPRRDNLAGGAWLLADMILNICALSLVKAMGLDIPAVQIVFLRSVVGLGVLAPWIWRRRDLFGNVPQPGLQALRVALAGIALSASYHAVARVPFALFTAVNYIRPLVVMALAVLLLDERIGPRRWMAAGIALCGVGVILGPEMQGASAGIATLLLAVLAGSAAVIVLRRLRDTHPLILITLHTIGVGLLTAPLALADWQPLDAPQWPLLLAIGLFTQCAQLCFLRAHRLAEAGFLSVLSYLGLLFSIAAGYLFFEEIPPVGFYPGAAMIVGAGVWVIRRARGR